MAGYGDDAGFGSWLTAEGETLPGGAPAPAVLRQRGSTYIDNTYGPRFSGVPTGGVDQERAWPRTGAMAWGVDLLPDVIPAAVVRSSYAAALREAKAPGSLSVVVTPGGRIKRRKIDVIETEYFEGGGDVLASATPLLTAVEGLLAPLLDANYGPTIFVV